ncbi:GNAT family N-acetyltransferase [Streptomyces beijiangensis]|uniref:GNAT family N-acetyltransferase n=1 Tax=Streptomyces beijiangensis TaxID=163361 RepID=A0A939FD73_9ACTN|nr:GNAT family N-acetyltransferase [Streptomyces beijiangensis]
MEIRRASDPAELVAAEHLFDGPARRDWSLRFLAAPGHLMLIAYIEGLPAGFITGIEMLHPDKGTEMCLYELGVAEPYRRRGIARALVSTLAEVARERDCYDMWVGVDTDNEPALAVYRASGAKADATFAMLTWTWN